MAQRHSEYARIPGDHYATPAWVVDALLSAEHFPPPVWEVAPGHGHMVRALEQRGVPVVYHDVDFLTHTPLPGFCVSIVTNPPFSKAEDFCRRALEVTEPQLGRVAMLLSTNFDSAKTRRYLFETMPFKAKYTITKRIRWANLEQKKNGPSTNHAWYVWDWAYKGKPYLGYLPTNEV